LWISFSIGENSLLIGEEYLVPLETGSLGIERRSRFEQLADAVANPCLERHDHHDSAWLWSP
jgi:hypothetical protein